MLTEKEVQVLRLRSKGFSQVEVAKKLKISQPAVSHFEKSAYKKISDAKKILKVAKELKVKEMLMKKRGINVK